MQRRGLASTCLSSLGLTLGLTLALAATGCDKPEKPAAKSADAKASTAAAEAAPGAKPVPNPPPEVIEAPPEPAKTPVVQSNLAPPGTGSSDIDRTRFPDPAWFTPEILPMSTVKHKGHSKPRQDGTFSSSLLLEAPIDLSSSDCIAAMKQEIGDELKWAEDQTGADGRITVRGETDRYFATLVCGQVKGKTVASVNYTWTK